MLSFRDFRQKPSVSDSHFLYPLYSLPLSPQAEAKSHPRSDTRSFSFPANNSVRALSVIRECFKLLSYCVYSDIASAIKDVLDAVNDLSQKHQELPKMMEYKRVSCQ